MIKEGDSLFWLETRNCAILAAALASSRVTPAVESGFRRGEPHDAVGVCWCDPAAGVCLVGFTVASMLSGFAAFLNQMVLLRLLQGMFGASLVPLSRAIMLDLYPVEQRARQLSTTVAAKFLRPEAASGVLE